MRARADDEFAALTSSFRSRLAAGESLDDLLPEAFAAVREAAARTIGQRHFDVQVMGGAVLHAGKIAEMRTGEGKTLTATLPGYLNALTGDGVHVLTADDYLARRDAEWMRPVYRFLGMRAGYLQPDEHPDPGARREEYGADLTYGAWERFGHDYVRDNLAWEPEELVQRGHHFAIVDEADLILIDAATIPMGISAPADHPQGWPVDCARIASELEPPRHYHADEKSQTVSLTGEGTSLVEDRLGITNLYDAANLSLFRCLRNALKAKEFFRKDHEYFIEDGQAVFIDPASGRPDPGRRFGGGVHEAIEAREGLTVRAARQTLGEVVAWDYLRQYQRLCGMTGVAAPEEQAYRQVYDLDVVTIPASRPTIRVDHPDAVYRTTAAKLAALADDTAQRHASGQPVLIGTLSIEQSDTMSRLLTERGVSHELLTARNHRRDAQIIADAARLGAVTIVAKMAGRGVDIILGGADAGERDAVADRGGLCVLGAERSSSRRAELHLRGRAGRQGDPGESRLYLSVEDDMIKTAPAWLARRPVRDGDEFRKLSAVIDSAQARMAAGTAAWLAQVVGLGAVLADQQHLVYAERRKALVGEDLPARIRRTIDEVIRSEVAAAGPGHLGGDRFWRELRQLYPVGVTPEALAAGHGCDAAELPPDFAAERIAADAQRAYDRREAAVGAAIMRELERRVTLAVIDRTWREHLQAMADLLQAIRARFPDGDAPLPDYRREAALLFTTMRKKTGKEITGNLFNVEIEHSGAAG